MMLVKLLDSNEYITRNEIENEMKWNVEKKYSIDEIQYQVVVCMYFNQLALNDNWNVYTVKNQNRRWVR